MTSLLAGLDAATVRLGLRAPVQDLDLASLHGVLMIFGFLGTAIALERAVAMQAGRNPLARIAYLAPVASVAAALLALAQVFVAPSSASRTGPALGWAASMVALLVIYVLVWRRQPAVAVVIQSLGAVCGLVAILLWAAGMEVAVIVPWWCFFLVFTIVGERAELARVAFKGGTELRLLGESLVVLLGLILTLLEPRWGYPLLGVALMVLCVDSIAHDVARRTINNRGLTRFMAAAMLAAYAWGIAAGAMWAISGPVYSGYGYDAVVHALTIGFAMSMVMAHAPVIVPAIARRTVPYSPAMWAVWGVLQAGLLIRVVAGARQAEWVWQFGGSLDVIAILAFVVMTLTLVITAQRRYARRREAVRARSRARAVPGASGAREGRVLDASGGGRETPLSSSHQSETPGGETRLPSDAHDSGGSESSGTGQAGPARPGAGDLAEKAEEAAGD